MDRHHTLASALLLAGMFSCAPRTPATVSLRMAGAPKTASVTIDDEFVGTLEVVSARGVALPPGRHRITVQAAGYLPWDRIVEASEGQGPVRVDAALVPIPE